MAYNPGRKSNRQAVLKTARLASTLNHNNTTRIKRYQSEHGVTSDHDETAEKG